jgi:dienelactone hydrolase
MSLRLVPSMRLRSTLACVVLAAACAQPLKLTRDDSKVVLAHQLLDAPNPADRGPYAVRTLYYGSGKDKQRRYYRDSVAIKTKPVDASAFVSMTPAQAKDRKHYWGFDAKQFPINGRVWYPEGAGPFPLVVIVHGNHNMKDYSDPGYQYLGEHLASRGFIFASLDENFLNGALRNENDGRAWMLLEHLAAWRGFNDSASSPLHGKVDMHNIAIMGHSRGGEAVGHAAAFNRLARYPDDAKVKFDFHFDIKSVVAIAPVDAQYKPAGQFTPVENVNYLVIHGSHDGDVSSFTGLRQWQRVRFTDGKPWFKSAWYVYRANHGQWNTVWGSTDAGPRSARFLDLRGLISPQEQRQFGKVVIGAFLEATLHNRREYLPLFRDHRVAGGWLPKTMYITRFQENGYKALANFEEDVDVTSGSTDGVSLTGDSLSTWKEEALNLRWQNTPMNDNAVLLGWNRHIAGDDTTKLGRPATYTVALADSLVRALHVDAQSSVYLSMAPTSDKPGPRQPAKDSTKKADSSKAQSPAKKPEAKKDEKDTTAIDFTVELVDANNVTARLPITRFGVPRRPLETHVLRRADREKTAFAQTYEIVLQTYVMPLAEFAKASPQFAPDRLKAIRLVFDRSPAATIIVDDIGVSAIDPAFLAQAQP